MTSSEGFSGGPSASHTEVGAPMTVTAALIWFVAQAVFTVTILVLGTMAAAGMLSPEERVARIARRAERKRKAAESSSSTSPTRRRLLPGGRQERLSGPGDADHVQRGRDSHPDR